MEAPCFVTDISPPQMLYALTIRSPVAKGRLKSIECPALPGNYTLISAKDIPGKNCLENSALPVLAHEELSYRGEPVALLLGPNKNMLEDFSRHCTVITEEDTPVFSFNDVEEGSIAARQDIRIGDTETAFAQAASVVHDVYSTGIQEHWYAEPAGALVWLREADATAEGEGSSKEETAKQAAVVVRTATQWPFHVRRSVAQILGLAASKILVKPAITGIHMDGKLWYPSLISCHAALGAWITKRPVRLVLTREEDFSFSPKRCETRINIASALNDKGEITGIEINTAVNLGAYGVNADEILAHVNLGSLGVYKAGNIRLSGVAYKTNIPPQGPFAGFGLAQGFFAIERHVSHIADTLKQDPAEWRSGNSMREGILAAGMPVKAAATVPQLIDTTMKASDYRRKWVSYELLRQGRSQHLSQDVPAVERHESLRGIGIALGYQGSGLLYPGPDKGNYSIEMILEKDGSLEIKTSMAGSDNDCGRRWTNIALKILGVDRDMIRIHCSTESPDLGPATMSRGVTVFARLVEQACLDISKKRFRDPLPISVRKTIRPQKNPAWNQFFSRQSADHSGFLRPGWASAVVEVEIDPIEYLPRIRGIWITVDGGRIISEERARRGLKNSTVQALGWTYLEQINYINGIIPLDQYHDFNIPDLSNIPHISIDFIRNDHDEPRGIGDLPFTCIPAAYLQAVSQSMDHHFQSIPLKALDMWYAGVSKQTKGGQA